MEQKVAAVETTLFSHCERASALLLSTPCNILWYYCTLGVSVPTNTINLPYIVLITIAMGCDLYKAETVFLVNGV